MNKKKIFTRLGIGTGILALSAGLLVGNISSAFSDSTTGKSSKYLEKEYTVRDSIVKTFNLDTNKVKPLFSRDVFDDDIATESADKRAKLSAALALLTKENIFKKGDFMPIYFLEGSNKVLIGINHPDGTTSLTEFDISKEKPVKIDNKVKEVKQ